MKRLTSFLFLFLFAFALQGQTILTNDSKVVQVYDANQPLNVDETCEVWLDGKDDGTFTLDGTSVNQWNDKSGNARHVLNGNADATRPTYDINTGRVTFTSANSTFLQSAAFASALTQPNTVFVVYKITGALNLFAYITDGVNVFCSYIMSMSTFRINSASYVIDGATNANDNIHVGLFNGASSEYWINGISKVSGDAGTNTLDGLTLGAARVFTSNADCEICEVIIYNADISDVSRDKITGYLANKWGITATTDFKGYIIRQD